MVAPRCVSLHSMSTPFTLVYSVLHHFHSAGLSNSTFRVGRRGRRRRRRALEEISVAGAGEISVAGAGEILRTHRRRRQRGLIALVRRRRAVVARMVVVGARRLRVTAGDGSMCRQCLAPTRMHVSVLTVLQQLKRRVRHGRRSAAAPSTAAARRAAAAAADPALAPPSLACWCWLVCPATLPAPALQSPVR